MELLCSGLDVRYISIPFESESFADAKIRPLRTDILGIFPLSYLSQKLKPSRVGAALSSRLIIFLEADLIFTR